jgi:hypothetical protein
VIEKVATLPTIRLGMKLFILSMVRKSELQDAVWDVAMTPAQYRDALARLDLTQVAAARLLGIDDRTSRRWAQYGTHGQREG